MIVRTDRDQLVEKSSAPATPGDTIYCEPDDCVVAMKWGAITRIYPAGEHPVAEDQLEIYFVRATAKTGIRAGGRAGSIDATELRAMIEYSLRVADPARFLVSLSSPGDGDAAVVAWVSSQVLDAVRSVVGEQQQALSVISDPMALAEPILERVRGSIVDMGLEVTELASMTFLM